MLGSRPIGSAPLGSGGGELPILVAAGTISTWRTKCASSASVAVLAGQSKTTTPAKAPSESKVAAMAGAFGQWTSRETKNEFANPTFEGGVAGSPGTVPIGFEFATGVSFGLTRTLDFGTEAGLPYMEVTLQGTPNATSALFCQQQYSAGGVYLAPSAPGERWVASWLHKLVRSTGVVPDMQVRLTDSPALNNYTSSADTLVGLGSEIGRTHATKTMAAGSLYAGTLFRIAITQGVPIDVTFRLYCPQLEKGVTPSAPSLQRNVVRPAYGNTFDGAAQTAVSAQFGRKNWVRNSSLSAPTPIANSAPDTWGFTLNGLTAVCNGFGRDEDGPYVEFRYHGTPTHADQRLWLVKADGLPVDTMRVGETWTSSVKLKAVGSPVGVNGWVLTLNGRTTAGSAVGDFGSQGGGSMTSGALTERIATRTFAAPTVTRASVEISFAGVVAGVPADFTFRVYDPQLEKGAVRTAFQPTWGILPRNLEPASVAAQVAAALWANHGKNNFVRWSAAPSYATINNLGGGSTMPQGWAPTSFNAGCPITATPGIDEHGAYWEFYWNGTTDTTDYRINPCGNSVSTYPKAQPGDVWSGRFQIKILERVGWSGIGMRMRGRNATGSLITGGDQISSIQPNPADGVLGEKSSTVTLNHADNAMISPEIVIGSVANGTPFTGRIRIYQMQVERGAVSAWQPTYGTLNSDAPAGSQSGHVQVYDRTASAMISMTPAQIAGVRTNLLYSSSVTGFVAGSGNPVTGGTLPSYWTRYNTGGVNTAVVAAGTMSDGREYIDIRYHGNPAATARADLFVASSSGVSKIPVKRGELVTGSVSGQVISGSVPAGSYWRMQLDENSDAPAYLGGGATLLDMNADLKKFELSRVMSDPNVTCVNLCFGLSFAAGAVDCVIRWVMPQLEKGVGTTAVPEIKTTAGAVSDFRCAMGFLFNNASMTALQTATTMGPRVNWCANNTFVGFVPGAIDGSNTGTLPSQWVRNTGAGIATNIVGVGVEDGEEYFDVQFKGTTTAPTVARVAATVYAPSKPGETWVGSAGVKIVAGTHVNGVMGLGVCLQQSGAPGENTTYVVPSAAKVDATTVRTLSTGATGLRLALGLNLPTNFTFDVTYRFYLPQLERGYIPTAKIRTTPTQPVGYAYDQNHSMARVDAGLSKNFGATLNRRPTKNLNRWSTLALSGAESSTSGTVTHGQLDPTGGTGATLIVDTSSTIFHQPGIPIQQIETGETYTSYVEVEKKVTNDNSIPHAVASLLYVPFDGAGSRPGIRFNPVTGQSAGYGGELARGVDDLGSYWRVWVTWTAQEGQTNFRLAILPSGLSTADTGSLTTFHFQTDKGNSWRGERIVSNGAATDGPDAVSAARVSTMASMTKELIRSTAAGLIQVAATAQAVMQQTRSTVSIAAGVVATLVGNAAQRAGKVAATVGARIGAVGALRHASSSVVGFARPIIRRSVIIIRSLRPS